MKFLLICLLLTTSWCYAKTQSAIFAAGCFWCAEHDFEVQPGVIKVVSGYTGGKVLNPTYEQVSAGGTGHYEAIQVWYDSAKISYEQLLNIFWRNVDPTDANGQFCDRGNQYRAAIFYQNKEQEQLAITSKQALIDSGKFKTIATQIIPATTFYPAETYHQNYAIKNPVRYRFYRYQCGRDQRLKQLWGSLSS